MQTMAHHTGTAVKRIFRYLSIKKSGNIRMFGYSDSDFASRRSCSGFIIKMADCTISWYSHRQEFIALSSTEAEYIALSSCAKVVVWLRQLASELCSLRGATCILVDNTSTIKLAEDREASTLTFVFITHVNSSNAKSSNWCWRAHESGSKRKNTVLQQKHGTNNLAQHFCALINFQIFYYFIWFFLLLRK